MATFLAQPIKPLLTGMPEAVTRDRGRHPKVQAAVPRTAQEQSRSYRALGLEVLQIESTGRTSDEVAADVARTAQVKPVEAYRAREAH